MSRILSLCTGYAGLDLAVEAVTGARTVAVSAGSLLRWARDRHYLEWAGTEASDRGNPAAKGRPVQVYQRTDKPVGSAA